MSLTRLSAELVGLVAQWLPARDLKTLLDSGDLALRPRILQGVTEIDGEILSCDVFPSWTFLMPNLRSLRVVSPPMNMILSPVSSKTLDFLPQAPCALRSIDFSFLPAMRILQPATDGRTLSSVCPSLTSLKLSISGGFNKEWLRNLPPNLALLHLCSTDVMLTWNAGDLALLPQTLHDLAFLGEDTVHSEERINWPPNLTSFSAHVTDLDYLVSSLPASVEHIRCSFEKVCDLKASALPPSLLTLEIQAELLSLTFDHPLPRSLRVFDADVVEYLNARNERIFTSDSDTVTEASVAEFASLLPKSLERLRILTTVPLTMAAKYLPAIRFWDSRTRTPHAEPPQWTFSHAESNLLSQVEERCLGKPHNPSHSPQLSQLRSFETAYYNTIDYQYFLWGSILPRSLTSFYGPLENLQTEKLIILSCVRLETLTVSWSPNIETKFSSDFLAHIGTTLRELSAPLQKLDIFSTSFLDEKPLLSWNPNFHTLGVTVTFGPWEVHNSRRFWSDLPLPLSLTKFSIAGSSNVLTQHAAMYSDWSHFQRLDTLQVSTPPDPFLRGDSLFGDLYEGEETDLDEESKLLQVEEAVTKTTHFDGVGTSFKFFDTLPPSLRTLTCFVPINISVNSMKALPRGLRTANFSFDAEADLFSWSFDHWRSLPPKLSRFVISYAALDPRTAAAQANGYGNDVLVDLLPPALLAIHVSNPTAMHFNTRAKLLTEEYFSSSFWQGASTS